MPRSDGGHPPPRGGKKRKTGKKSKNRTHLPQRLVIAMQIGSVLATIIRMFRHW